MSRAHTIDPARIHRADPPAIAAAADLLRRGRLVAFPTETVYGLGADATDDRAVAGIFAVKDRPRINPLIVHVADLDQARGLVSFDARGERLAARFWPGPLTLVLPRRPGCPISLLCSAGLDTQAVRVPGHEVALALLRTVARPVAAPSANPSGRVSPTTAEHVARDLDDRVAMILDRGPCPIGLESTVVDLSGPRPRLLRPGAIGAEALAEVAGALDAGTTDDSRPLAPGQLASHYAPDRPLRLDARAVAADEALLAFGPRPLNGAAETCNLSAHGDLEEAASRLFACLRRLDRPQHRAIAAMPIPEQGLGLAINDRLRRAAASRLRSDGRAP